MTKPRSTLLAAVAFGLLLVAANLPPLAVVAAWPFLVVVPGWWLVVRVAPALAPPGRLGAGVVTSVFIASHLVNVLAHGLGFGRPSILATTGVLIGATWLLATRPLPFLADPPTVSRVSVRRAMVRYRTAWLLAGGTFLVVLTVLGLSAWHQTPDGWVSGGWNWSDFLVHVSIGNSIVHGNFPPQLPYYAGVPLIYHWFADFHGAILAAVAGMPIIPVFIVSSAAMAGILALVLWELTRRLTLNRRAAAIAVILACFGGGLGWIRLILDLQHGQGSLVELLTRNSYDNTWAGDWPFFRIASVLGTGLLTHRATAFGLPALVAIVLLVQASVGRRPAGVLLGGILAALLAPFQFFFFPATYLIVGLLFVSRRIWRRRMFVREALLFGAPVVLALPFVARAVSLQAQRGAFHLVPGWSEARFSDGLPAVAFFYATNLGLPALLAVVAVAVAAIGKRRLVNVQFLGLWLFALFLVPNVVVVSSVAFDMNKYFQVMLMAAAILAAWLLRNWPRPVVALVLAISAISPALVSTWDVLDPSVALTPDQQLVAQWIEVETPERAIFVTDAWINSPVDLAGRLRVTGFGPYVANLGYDPDARARDVHAAYCDGDAAAAAVMARYGATYVLSSGGLIDCGGKPPTDFDGSPRFETAERVGTTTVWRLRR
ncbi:MAG TPA: hypothetical protein VIM30_15225 [Candidatus Limnocylindrales bacterium]|jgi:hypothetical protein